MVREQAPVHAPLRTPAQASAHRDRPWRGIMVATALPCATTAPSTTTPTRATWPG